MIILLLTRSILAAEIVVKPSGGDFSHIQDAIDAANPGDTVVVEGGVYTEAVQMRSEISLIGRNHPEIEANGTPWAVLLDRVERASVSGFSIRHTPPPRARTSTAVDIRRARSVAVLGNTIEGASTIGLGVAESTDISIAHNNIRSCGHRGVDVWDAEVRIVNNFLYRNPEGIAVTADRFEVRNNTLRGGQTHLLLAPLEPEAEGSRVAADNLLVQSASAAVELAEPSTIRWENNAFWNNQAYGRLDDGEPLDWNLAAVESDPGFTTAESVILPADSPLGEQGSDGGSIGASADRAWSPPPPLPRRAPMTWRVAGPSDGDLQRVLDQAWPGDQVVLGEGVWSGEYRVPSGVQLEGAGPGRTRIEGGVRVSRAQDVLLWNLAVDGGAGRFAPDDSAVSVKDSRGVAIERVVVTGRRPIGVAIRDSADVRVSSVEVSGSSGLGGIDAVDSSSVMVSDTTLSRTGRFGVRLRDSDAVLWHLTLHGVETGVMTDDGALKLLDSLTSSARFGLIHGDADSQTHMNNAWHDVRAPLAVSPDENVIASLTLTDELAVAADIDAELQADPRFVDAHSGDFSLAPSSPYIGRATDGGDLGALGLTRDTTPVVGRVEVEEETADSAPVTVVAMRPSSAEVVASTEADRETGAYRLVVPEGAALTIAISTPGHLPLTFSVAPELPPPARPAQIAQIRDGASSTFRTIHFTSGRAELSGASHAALHQVVRFMADNPGVEVEVIGHTDGSGDAGANQKLSVARAKQVVSFLSKEGVDSARMQALGRGESVPIAENTTEAGRLLNRRVEIRVRM